MDNNNVPYPEALEKVLQGPPERTAVLHSVPEDLAELVRHNRYRDAAHIARIIANTAGGVEETKDGPRWRVVFAEEGILDYILRTLSSTTQLDLELAKQYLRVIGNCVANDVLDGDMDEDLNRDATIDFMPEIAACLKEEALASTAVGVLANLCNNYERAQDRAALIRLDCSLGEYLATLLTEAENKTNDIQGDESNDYEEHDEIVRQIFDITQLLPSVQLQDADSFTLFETILNKAMGLLIFRRGTTSPIDQLEDCAGILIRYLQDQNFGQKLIASGMVERLIDFTCQLESLHPKVRLDEMTARLSSGMSTPESQVPSFESAEDLVIVQLVDSLSAISASDEFVRRYNTTSPELVKLKSRLYATDKGPTTVLACVMLGNLAISDDVAIQMVDDMGLHRPLLDILLSESQPALLYPAAGFIRHLAFPERNRAVLGQTGLIETCCRLLSQSDPSVRGEAAAIIEKLASNNLPNIRRIIYERAPGTVEEPKPANTGAAEGKTIFQYLVEQALAPTAPVPSVSMKNAMVEIGRAIVTILRCISQPSNESDVQDLARSVCRTPLVSRPLARLVRQRFFANARSEGLLGLGLMAQSREGAERVVEEIKADRDLLGSVKECASSQEEGKEEVASNMGRDRQNALVLLHALGKNGIDAMDASLSSEIGALQNELSHVHGSSMATLSTKERE